MNRGFVIAASAFAACTFAPRADVHDGPSPTHDGIVVIDTPSEGVSIDAAACTGPSVTCSDDNTLRMCTAAGSAAITTTCSWGCTGSAAHCAQLQPGGGGVLASDVAPGSNLAATTLSGDLIINSDTGAIGSSGDLTSLRGSGSGVIAGIEFEQRGSGNIGVFRFASLTVSDPVVLVGRHAVALVADGDIAVNALLDARGSCGATIPGPGGSSGGSAGENGLPNGGGGQGGGNNNHGGGGGADGGSGGEGGNHNLGGSAFGDFAITPLVGGGGGGGGDGGPMSGAGGGGGGAVQLASNSSIAINTGTGINAGGCGGFVGFGANDGGGGGGAGGAILLEAPVVTIMGTLAVNGGAGGGGNDNGSAGAQPQAPKGALSRTAVVGTEGNALGGAGAAGSALDGAAGSNHGGNGGGGGGGIGWIRLETRSGSAALAGSVLSPSLDDSPTTCSQGSASTQ